MFNNKNKNYLFKYLKESFLKINKVKYNNTKRKSKDLKDKIWALDNLLPIGKHPMEIQKNK